MPRNKQNAPRKPPREESARKSEDGITATPWTFLTNHSHVLIVLHSEPDLVLREVALRVGITERAVQRIIQELEQEGYLTRERVGRRNRYHILATQNLRHPIESHCTIEQVLKVINNPRTLRRRRS